MGLFHTKDRHEFKPLIVEIEENPTSPAGRKVMWSIFAFIVISLLWLFFAEIDVVVSARGKVIPMGEIKILQPVETGVVSVINIKEGQKVSKGEVLIEIDSSVSETNAQSKHQNLSLLELEIERLYSLIENRPFSPKASASNNGTIQTQIMIYNALKSSQEQQLNVITSQLELARSNKQGAFADKARLKELLKNAILREGRLFKVLDLIATSDYEDAQNQLVDYQQKLKMKTYETEGLSSKINEIFQQLDVTRQEYRNKLLETLTQKEKEATLLRVEIQDIEFRKAKQQIISSVDGYIGKLFIHTVGGVVTPAEKLVTIIPQNVPLVIQAIVINQDRGFIKKQMPTAIKIDTFDFQKYGLLEGKVTHIADDAIEDEKLGPVYEVTVVPNQDYLIVEGEKRHITPGLSVTAELKVGKRRIIDFFIYPMIKYLNEGLSVR